MLKPSPLLRVWLWLANLAWMGFVLLPIVAVVFAAVQSERALTADVEALLPSELTLSNFQLLLTGGRSGSQVLLTDVYLPDTLKHFVQGFANSLMVAAAVTLLTLVCGTLSAHALVRLRPRWGNWLLQANVAARFLPILVLVIPLYILLRRVGLLNSLAGVVVTEVGLLVPFAFVILVPFFESQPTDMEEAARLDGCTRFGAFLRVALPLAAPGLAACGSIVFIVSWHELLVPLVLTSRPEMMTLPAILSHLVGEWVFFNLIMATALLALLPSVVLVLLLQKYVVAGLSGGALKG